MERPQPYIHKDLLIQIADGDETAFATLFTLMVPLLRPGILKLVRSEDVFREILQEAFLKIWLHRDRLPHVEKPESWIYKIAANECFDWLNQESKRFQQTKHLAGDQNSLNSSTEQYFAFKETRELVQRAVSMLPQKKKTIYQLSRSNGLKTTEIAEKLNVSHSYVRNAISEALHFIRQYLKQAGQLIVIVTFFR